jgi:NAD(P)-dependent dehydrogenase (short-subunit alcohol dehydrogenase family)
MQDWLTLGGRPALVFGAGGLGGASALSLAAQGARVALVDMSQENLDAVVRAAKEAGREIKPLVADLRTARACRAAAAEAAGLVGTPQVFLHAVGRNVRKPVLELDDADWDETLTLNLSSAYWLGRAVGRLMVEERYGRMVFVSSVSGLLAHPHHAPYAAAKGGMNQMLRVMAREWAAHGVTVNAVAPGYIETSLTRSYLDKDNNRESLESLVPAQRLGQPEEVADAVTFLASDRARFITGQVLYVDGGRVLV